MLGLITGVFVGVIMSQMEDIKSDVRKLKYFKEELEEREKSAASDELREKGYKVKELERELRDRESDMERLKNQVHNLEKELERESA